MSALYTYECPDCGNVFEKLFHISDFDLTRTVRCPKCVGLAKRIINNRGALRGEPTWLPSACEVAVPDGERPPQNRSEWNAFKKKEGFEEKCDYGPRLAVPSLIG